MSINVLVHYNPRLKRIMTVDASPVCVGAVLSRIMPEGSEKPIYFVSRILSRAEQNYTQIKKEGIVIISGVSKFHKYIYVHYRSTLLIKEFGAISPTISARLQHCALILSSYHYQFECKPSSKISNANLPLEDYLTPLLCPKKVVLSMSGFESTSITSRDFVLSQHL